LYGLIKEKMEGKKRKKKGEEKIEEWETASLS